MLSNTIDVAAFFTWFFEEYPNSGKLVKDSPEIMNKFR